ncbi:MAG: RNA polymerase Rpb4 family protein [Candidatus Thermoplasmatota archaeon]|nr:RNA polymerase Rpb4 family protein [Candidatus Thermoplasmatota archaeon]
MGEERNLTLAEVKEILEEENEARGELNHEQGFALQHVRSVVRIPAKRTRSVVEELMGIEGVNETIAVNLVDIMPTHIDDIKAVFHKERYDVSEETVKKIMEIIEENM